MRCRLGRLYLCAIWAMNCGPRETGTTPEERVLDNERVPETVNCEDPSNRQQCVRERERALLADLPGVRRSGDSLVIAIPGGSPVVLIDSVDQHGVGHHYIYTAFSSELNAHLIQVQLYEGSGFLLVAQRTGAATALDALPVPAPDGARLITTSWDTEAGYNSNRVRIFRVDADSLVLEWELEPTLWGPDQPRWIDDSTVVISRRPALLDRDSMPPLAPLTVRREGGTWKADPVTRAP